MFNFKNQNESEVRFLTYEGYAKLLLNNATIPNKAFVLFKLVVAYNRNESPEPTDAKKQPYFDHKLKSCLGTFFRQFTATSTKNSEQLSQVALPMFKSIFDNNKLNVSLKKLANFFYFFSSNVRGKRPLIVHSILSEIMDNLRFFNSVQRWTDILVEFNLHPSDVDDDSNNSRPLLKNICEKMTKLFVRKKIFILNYFKIDQIVRLIKEVCKKEKWKLRKETDLKHLFETVKNLLSSGESNGKRRNSYESEEETVDSKRSKQN